MPATAAVACGPVLSKLRAVLTRPFAADLFGTAASTFGPREILDVASSSPAYPRV